MSGQDQAHPLCIPVTIIKLEHAIEKKNISSGIDVIHYPMIAQLPQLAKDLLLNIFNKIWINKSEIPKI